MIKLIFLSVCKRLVLVRIFIYSWNAQCPSNLGSSGFLLPEEPSLDKNTNLLLSIEDQGSTGFVWTRLSSVYLHCLV